MSTKTLVIALGGNAISMPFEEGSIPQQFARTQETAKHLADLIQAGYHPVITHGNGPQVGNILRRVEIASSELYSIPLEVCVADTQAGMGYMIGQCLLNELHHRGIERQVTTLVTTVLVDHADPAFASPSKPIGPRLQKADAEHHQRQDGWSIREVDSGLFRRIVPSPHPREILELEAIRHASSAGQIVICCGGGGIPVIREQGGLMGAGAVVDKDRTTGMLAAELDVDKLIILTAVDHAYINFGQTGQRALKQISTAEAAQYMAEGHFAEGSMRPKMEAAIAFANSAGANAEAIVTNVDSLANAMQGTAGTRISNSD